MAVIESKGDGFALYNGVKLRNIDTVWDKKKYLYVAIRYNRGTKAARLYFSQQPITLSVADAEGIVLAPAVYYDLNSEAWELAQSKETGKFSVDIDEDKGFLYTSHDIINNDDNTVYLAASEPISLDGMNVIEWDGDTTGLETLMSNAYFVSHNTDVDTDKDVVYVSTGGVNPLFGITALQNFDIGYWGINRVMNYSTVASEDYPIVGIEFQSSSKGYTSLFAYYPIAETTITFNNKTYSINDASLSDATTALQSHLSTVMNGSGAVIHLGGTSYNVDSTKLTTARNAFVSHLGTIAGSGSKVVVNGVEYNVDAAKMQSAIAELETAWGNLQ